MARKKVFRQILNHKRLIQDKENYYKAIPLTLTPKWKNHVGINIIKCI